MLTQIEPRAVLPGQARTVAVIGQRYTFLARAGDTGGAFAMLLTHVPAGDPGPPPHTHTREDESFYILAGEITFTLGEREIVAPAGAFVFAPRGTRHAFRNVGTVPAQMLLTITPAGFEGFFDAVGDDWTGRNDPPPPPTQEHIRRILESAPAYGMTIHSP